MEDFFFHPPLHPALLHPSTTHYDLDFKVIVLFFY